MHIKASSFKPNEVPFPQNCCNLCVSLPKHVYKQIPRYLKIPDGGNLTCWSNTSKAFLQDSSILVEVWLHKTHFRKAVTIIF